MIDDLDATISDLLSRELSHLLGAQVAITFETPDADFPPPSVALPAIDFFLYDVRENVELRSTEWGFRRSLEGAGRRLPPALRVDCSYLVTAWPSNSAPNPAQDEHRLLSEVLRVLVRHTTLPGDVLRGSLEGLEPPLPATSLQPGHLQSLSEFWQALGGRPKAALNYTVTIAVDVHEPEEVPLVTEKVIRMKHEHGVGG
jgi:hypothetical protein